MCKKFTTNDCIIMLLQYRVTQKLVAGGGDFIYLSTDLGRLIIPSELRPVTCLKEGVIKRNSNQHIFVAIVMLRTVILHPEIISYNAP